MRAHPTPPVDDAAAPPAVARGKAAAGPALLDAAGLASRIRVLVEMFESHGIAAGVAGRSTDAIGRWMNGTSVPAFDALSKLAFAKGVSLEWLATGIGDAATGSHDLMSVYSALPPDVRTRIDQAIVLIARAHEQREADIEHILRLTLGASA